MQPYSLDLRQRIVTAYENDEGSIREMADRFSVSARTVSRYLLLRRTTGGLHPRPRRYGPRRLLTVRNLRVLRTMLREKNDQTDAEIARAFTEKTRVKVSARTINRTWQREGISRKKKERSAPASRTGPIFSANDERFGSAGAIMRHAECSFSMSLARSEV